MNTGTALEDVTERASRALAVLGNETRLGILLVLWESHDERSRDNAMTFSELRARVGMRDSGQFSYHLEKLLGEFVRKSEDGYTIRQAGLRLMRAVVAGVGVPEPSPEPVVTDVECPICGAPTALSYVDEMLFRSCTACEGFFGPTEEWPGGTLIGYDCTRAALVGRDLEAVARAVDVRAVGNVTCMLQGVCLDCTGPVERSLSVCADHESEGVCGICHSRFEATAELECEVCRQFLVGPVWMTTHHPEMRSLFREYGVPFSVPPRAETACGGREKPIGDLSHEVLSADPPRVQVRLTHDDGTVSYTVDAALSVGDVRLGFDDGIITEEGFEGKTEELLEEY